MINKYQILKYFDETREVHTKVNINHLMRINSSELSGGVVMCGGVLHLCLVKVMCVNGLVIKQASPVKGSLSQVRHDNHHVPTNPQYVQVHSLKHNLIPANSKTVLNEEMEVMMKH